jgi:hypothetical protein
MTINSPREIIAADNYYSYIRGWKDGVASKLNPKVIEGHRLYEIYMEGYTAGQVAKHDAFQAAQAKYSFVPNFLRTVDVQGG